MIWNALFFLNSILLGVGLAMDAFSVSIADGLNEPGMKKSRAAGIAGCFAGFQALMPMLGWTLVHTAVSLFGVLHRFIPWIALGLLGWIGGKMLYEGLRRPREDGENRTAGALGLSALLLQGVATSIDALSVGFTIAEYGVREALVCSLLIAAVTFVLCLGGVFLGKRFGMRLASRASVLGGLILIAIGLEIFIKSFLE